MRCVLSEHYTREHAPKRLRYADACGRGSPPGLSGAASVATSRQVAYDPVVGVVLGDER